MGEISDALSREKRLREAKDESSPRRSSMPASQEGRVHDASSDTPRESDERFSEKSSASPSNRRNRVDLRAPIDSSSGLNAQTRAEILSPRTAALPAPTASPSAAPIHRVPSERDEFWVQRLCAVEPDAPAAVRFRHFGARVRSILDRATRKSVLVTSAFAGEGKTTVATNLALAIASISPDRRVALVDLDLRRGTIGKVMGYSTPHGIEDALSGKCSLDEVRVETDLNKLDFYPTGRSVNQAHQILGGGISRILDELHDRYDYVICDGPPVLPVPDVPLIAPYVGGCLAVAGSGKTRHRFFRQLMEHIPRDTLFGVFLNECPSATFNGDYRYYGVDDDNPRSDQ